MATPEIQCSNKDCRVAETGKCVEGLATDACPNFGKVRSLQGTEGATGETRAVALSSAARLSLDQAVAIMRRDESRVIAIVGPHDAGKTSLIAGLYDLFQHGPVGDNYFNGSHTLHAFEMSCHDARSASERNVPHINRTPLGEVEFFHVGVTQHRKASRLALLVGDRAGEDYRSAADNVQIVSSFHEIRRADTLTFLVDGRRLEQSVTRHQARNELLRLVQALVDGGGTSQRQQVAVVLTKLDEVYASANRDRALSDFATDTERLRAIFPTSFATIKSFQVAASPKKHAIQRGTGVADLLAFWVGTVKRTTNRAPTTIESERVYRRLKEE